MIHSADGNRIEDVVREKREEILRIAEQHGAYNVRLFGSVARGEAGPHSDVDLLIDVDDTRTTPWFPGGLIADLEDLLGRRVDIVFADSIRPAFAPFIRSGPHPQTRSLAQPVERGLHSRQKSAETVRRRHGSEAGIV